METKGLLVWKKLYSEEGILVYEGYTLNNKACGEGIVYYPNGKVYQEGVFDIKGLVDGKEYYQNGKLRFKGEYRINRGYGPNYPLRGTCYDRNGNPVDGGVRVDRTGAGYPVIRWPKGCDPIPKGKRPSFPLLMWEDKQIINGAINAE